MLEQKTVQIYVYLRDEGTDVWRPVNAVQLSENVYRIIGPIIEGEDWEFQPGEAVRCKKTVFPEKGTHPVAYERVAGENSN